MGNRQAREFMKEQDRLAAIAKEEQTRNKPRAINTWSDSRRDVGQLRIQIIVYPSFDEPCAWEVREKHEQWLLWESNVVDESLVGFEPVAIDSQVLHDFFHRALKLKLPLAPDLSNNGGADGSVCRFALFGDLYSGFHFQWWSDSPAQWQPLVDLAYEMIGTFLQIDVAEGENLLDWFN